MMAAVVKERGLADWNTGSLYTVSLTYLGSDTVRVSQTYRVSQALFYK